MSPTQALSTAIADFVSVVWANVISMITGNYYLMIYLAGGLIAVCFTYFAMARDCVR